MHSIAEIHRANFGDLCPIRLGLPSPSWAYNAIRESPPAVTRRLHLDRVWSQTQEMASWLLDHRSRFGPDDQLQIIVTWPDSIRRGDKHIIRAYGDFDEYARLVTVNSIASY